MKVTIWCHKHYDCKIRRHMTGVNLECKNYMTNYVSDHTESIRDNGDNSEEGVTTKLVYSNKLSNRMGYKLYICCVQAPFRLGDVPLILPD